MEVSFIDLEGSDIAKLAQATDLQAYLVDEAIQVLTWKVPNLNWSFFTALPPKGFWWASVLIIFSEFENWKRVQYDSKPMYRKFKSELNNYQLSVEGLPQWVAYCHYNSNGEIVSESSNPRRINIFDACSWFLPSDKISKIDFKNALLKICAEYGSWSFTAINEEKSIEIDYGNSSLKKTDPMNGVAWAKTTLENDYHEWVVWLTNAKSTDANPFTLLMQIGGNVNIASWMHAPEEKRDEELQLVNLRLDILEKHLPPSFYGSLRIHQGAIKMFAQFIKNTSALASGHQLSRN